MYKIMKLITMLREQKGWSRVKLLSKIDMRITQSYFCNMEKGFYFPPPKFVIKAAKALGQDPANLYELVIEEKKEILERQLRDNFQEVLKKEGK